MVCVRRVAYWKKSGSVEPSHTLVAERIADVRTEKPALRFGGEEGLVIGGRELKVAIDMAGGAESQIEYLLGIVIGSR